MAERVLDCGDFGVITAGLLVPALADDLAVLDNDRADRRIRASVAHASFRELQRSPQKVGVILRLHCPHDPYPTMTGHAPPIVPS